VEGRGAVAASPPLTTVIGSHANAARASEWAQVSAYAESLEAIMGPGSMPRLLEQVTENADELLPLARRLFASWLEHVVRVPARAIG
jgi:hypothetical protein